ncbi:hypothetical protein, partial [Paracoccus rhizosphaerae]
MARQDIREMDRSGCRWQATTRVAIPIIELASDLTGATDDQVLGELRNGVFDGVPGIFTDRHALRAAGIPVVDDEHGDLVKFDSVGRDSAGRPVVYAHITSMAASRCDFVEGLKFGVNYTALTKRTKSVLNNESVRMTTMLCITHVQHPDDPSFPG